MFFRSGLGSYLDDVDGAALFCVHAGFQSFRGGVLLDIRPAVVRDVENGRAGFCAQAAADAAFRSMVAFMLYTSFLISSMDEAHKSIHRHRHTACIDF